MPSRPRPSNASVPRRDDGVAAVLATLKRLGTKKTRDEMGPRYGIWVANGKVFGVSMAKMKVVAKSLGKSHELAAGLWETGWYDARMLAALVSEPARVTPAQMDRWARDFDNWGLCDTMCFHLFDRTPHAFAKVEQWSTSKDEFVKRAAFALLASVALHNKKLGDEPFIECLPLIERGAADERNFVKKGVSWALRGTGRRNPALLAASVKVAERLAASDTPSCRWVGKDALRDFAKVRARLNK